MSIIVDKCINKKKIIILCPRCAQTCSEATTYEKLRNMRIIKIPRTDKSDGFDARKSRSSMPKPCLFSTLRSAAQPPRFNGRAIRDAAGEHRWRLAGGGEWARCGLA